MADHQRRQERGSVLLRIYSRAKRLGLVQPIISSLQEEQREKISSSSYVNQVIHEWKYSEAETKSYYRHPVPSDDDDDPSNSEKAFQSSRFQASSKNSDRQKKKEKKTVLEKSVGTDDQSVHNNDDKNEEPGDEMNRHQSAQSETQSESQEYFNLLLELTKEKHINTQLRKKNEELEQRFQSPHIINSTSDSGLQQEQKTTRKDQQSPAKQAEQKTIQPSSPNSSASVRTTFPEHLAQNISHQERLPTLEASMCNNGRTERQLRLSQGYIKLLIEENQKLNERLKQPEKC